MNTEASLTREIASRVRAARESLEPKLTQEELGAKIGLSKVGYGHYERGTQPFSVWHLYQLARVLGRPLEYFLGLTTESPPGRADPSRGLSASGWLRASGAGAGVPSSRCVGSGTRLLRLLRLRQSSCP